MMLNTMPFSIVYGIAILFLFVFVLVFAVPYIASICFLRHLPTRHEMMSRIRHAHRYGTYTLRVEQSLQNTTFALVLAGGGGKGAYQIGVLRALARFGISEFTAISGTSVGALNGMLIAQGDLKKATKIWRNMRPNRILNPPLTFPIAFFFRLMMLPIMIIRYGMPRARTWILLIEKRFEYFFVSDEGTREMVHAVVTTIVKLCVSIIMFGLTYLLVWPTLTETSSVNELIIVLLFLNPLIPGIISTIFVLEATFIVLVSWQPAVAAHDFLMDKLSLFSNGPLQDLVTDCIDVNRLSRTGIRHLFVTVAHRGVVLSQSQGTSATAIPIDAQVNHDSDILINGKSEEKATELSGIRKWWADNVSPSSSDFTTAPNIIVPTGSVLRESVAFIANYRNLMQLRSKTEFVANVVQSAGLPEVFPRREVQGKPAVDGGVADNVPLKPILKLVDPPMTIVIELGKPIKRKQWLARVSGKFESEYELLKMPISEYRHYSKRQRQDIKDRIDTARKEAKSVSVKVLPIIPSKPLGGLVTGTMNFHMRKARALIWLGYWDTIQSIEKGFSDLDVKYPKDLRVPAWND